MSERAKAGEAAGAGVVMAGRNDGLGAHPYFGAAVECVGPNGVRWRDGFPHNVVVNGGAEWLINKALGHATASTHGPFAALHSATVGSGNVWSQISASQVGSYGNNVPLITFASNAAGAGVRSVSTSCSYAFTAGTQTVSGLAIHWYTTNTLSTNAATADVRMYGYGTFTNGSRQVQNGDTLNATLTVSFGTA